MTMRREDIERVADLLLEKATKPGVMSLAGIAAERKCARELGLYFRKVTAQLRGRLIGFHSMSNASVAKHSAQIAAASIVRRNTHQLQAILEKHIQAAVLTGYKQDVMHEAAKPKVTGDLSTGDKLGLSGEDAAAYAAESAAQSVTGINATTVEKFADAVSTAIEDQLGVQGLSSLLRDISDEMTVVRAETIAAFEIADAFGEAALRKLNDEGIGYKQLIPSPGACEICLSIIDNGPIPTDEPFVDDDGEEYDRSPIHVNCRCATVGARGPEED
jgi:hypothetical protein